MKELNTQENTDEEIKIKSDRELCWSHVLEEKYTLTRENETGFVNFLHMCTACNVMSRELETGAIIFDIAVTFGHCQNAINKGVATLGYTYALAHSLIMNNLPFQCIQSEKKRHTFNCQLIKHIWQ